VPRVHCIFDLDGTLFDSHLQIVRAVDWTRNHYGFEAISEDDIKNLIGLPAKRLFQDIVASDLDMNEVVATFRNQLKHEIATLNNLYSGAEELLQELKRLGARISIATTKPTDLAVWTIKHSKLNSLVDFVQGTDNFLPKPSPEVILRCMRESTSSLNCMFGDRKEDMAAANSAKVTGIWITQTIHSHQELIEAGARFTFPRIGLVSEITKVIKNLD